MGESDADWVFARDHDVPGCSVKRVSMFPFRVEIDGGKSKPQDLPEIELAVIDREEPR